MKHLITVIRVFVALVFIASGLVKANDPLGLSYKMQEFFEVWGFTTLHFTTLPAAVIMIVVEIVTGVALLVGWRPKEVTRMLLVLILFFTFLTGYAYLSGKFKSCGCFGDCLPISPFQSFLKDLVLLGLIIALMRWQQYIKQSVPSTIGGIILIVATGASSYMQVYVLNNLPFVDCLPYKVGNNLVEKMQMPIGATLDSFAITFRYKKAGQIVEFDGNSIPEDLDSTYEFVDRYDKLVKKGTDAKPPISDLVFLNANRKDTTIDILNQPGYYILLWVKNPQNIDRNLATQIKELKKLAATKYIPLFIVTGISDMQYWAPLGFSVNEVLLCDYTVSKTAARVDPMYMLMQQANVIDKHPVEQTNSFFQELQQLKSNPEPYIFIPSDKPMPKLKAD